VAGIGSGCGKVDSPIELDRRCADGVVIGQCATIYTCTLITPLPRPYPPVVALLGMLVTMFNPEKRFSGTWSFGWAHADQMTVEINATHSVSILELIPQ